MKRTYEVGHVLMTADAAGEAWRHSLELARGLAKHGVRTSLATMGAPLTAPQREEALGVSGLQLYVSEYQLESAPDAWADVDAAGNWLLALAERIQPDVVHLHSYSHAALPWRAPVLMDATQDLVSKDYALGRDADDLAEYSKRVTLGLQAAGMVIAPTAATVVDLQRHFGPLADARVIRRSASYLNLGPVRKRAMVVAVGSTGDEAANLGALQRVASHVDSPIYIAGDLGNHRHPHTHGINFLGRLSPAALGAWYSRSAIFAAPSRYDSTGEAVRQAAAAGCALVLGDIPTLREQWNEAAIFVSPTDSKALAAAIRLLETDEEMCKALGAKAEARAKELSPATMTCEYLFAYQDLRQTASLGFAPEVCLHPRISLR